MTNSNRGFSRREFLVQCMLASAGAFVLEKAWTGGFSTIVGANNRLRVGIVGLGENGLDHIRQFIRLPNVQIAAVCDTDESRFGEVGTLLGGGHPAPIFVTDYRRFADINDLDAVTIAVPMAKRMDMALDFCDAGKEMMIERPFSTTAREGKRLVDVVDSSQRLVQQRDDAFVVAADEASGLAMSEIGPIASVIGWKSASRPSGGVGDYFENMAEQAWTDLDLARCLIGGRIPTRLATRSVGQQTPGLERIAVDIEYRAARIEFEVTGGGFPAVSQTRFVGKNGKLTVTTDPMQDEMAKLASFMNFVDSIKEAAPERLINPVGEARKSNFLIELAKESLSSGGSLTIDPETEAASAAKPAN